MGLFDAGRRRGLTLSTHDESSKSRCVPKAIYIYCCCFC